MGAEAGKCRVAASAVSVAAPPVVFALLRDGPSWPTWSMFTGFELERPGAPDPLGLGAVRVNITAVSRAREEVVAFVPDQTFAYVLLSGLPMTNYLAEVELTPTNSGGTVISWRAAFDPKIPGTGWFWRLFMGQVLGQLCRQLAAAADRAALPA